MVHGCAWQADEAERKRLWMIIVRYLLHERGDVGAGMAVLGKCGGVLEVEDVLLLFPPQTPLASLARLQHPTPPKRDPPHPATRRHAAPPARRPIHTHAGVDTREVSGVWRREGAAASHVQARE